MRTKEKRVQKYLHWIHIFNSFSSAFSPYLYLLVCLLHSIWDAKVKIFSYWFCSFWLFFSSKCVDSLFVCLPSFRNCWRRHIKESCVYWKSCIYRSYVTTWLTNIAVPHCLSFKRNKQETHLQLGASKIRKNTYFYSYVEILVMQFK